jgi:hypothetical protein
LHRTQREPAISESSIQPPAIPPPLPHAHVALTPEQLARLQTIGSAYRALRRAANVAAFSGITTLSLGILSVSCLAFDATLGAITATVALCTFGITELIGRQRLLKGAADSLRILAWNQLAFFAAVAIYCIVQMVTFSPNAVVSPEDQAMLKQLGDTTGLLDPKTWKPLNALIYAAIIVVSFASQGGLAFYYARRRKSLDLFHSASEAEKQLLLQITP